MTAEQIFLSVLGSLATVVGVLIPLTSIGIATTALVDASTIAAAAERGGQALAEGATAGLPKSLAQPLIQPPKDPSPDADPGPDAINPVVSTPQNPPSPGPMVEITQVPIGNNPRTGHPTFIGNGLWVAPGVLTSLGNTIWGDLKPQS